MRAVLTVAAMLASLALAAGAASSTSGWVVAKRSATAQAGQLAFVGTIVRNPGGLGVRATVPTPRTIALKIVLSCRRGLTTRVGGGRISGRAPFTKAVRLPLSGAAHCAISATGTNPAGTLRLEILKAA